MALVIPGTTSTATPALRQVHLLSSVGEDKGIAALETDYPFAAAGQVDQERIDLLLAHDVPAAPLGSVDDLGIGSNVLQEVPGRQRVDDDHVRLA